MSGPIEADALLDRYREATAHRPEHTRARLAELRAEVGGGGAAGGEPAPVAGSGAATAGRARRVPGWAAAGLVALGAGALWLAFAAREASDLGPPAEREAVAEPGPVGPPSTPEPEHVGRPAHARSSESPGAGPGATRSRSATSEDRVESSQGSSRTRRRRRPSRPRATAEGDSARSRALSEEVALLARARRALRAGQADAALAALHEHARRFPRGQLVRERERSMVTALCLAGRHAQAKAEAERAGMTWTGCPT